MSPTPRLSQLQFLVLGTLLQGQRPGREIRDELARFGVKRSGPSFYQLMSRLEEGQFAEGQYQQRIVDSQIIRERTYKLTASGRRAWDDCRRLNETIIAEFGASSA